MNQLCAEILGAGINSQTTALTDEIPTPTPTIITPPIAADATVNPIMTVLLQTMVSSMNAMRNQLGQVQAQVIQANNEYGNNSNNW